MKKIFFIILQITFIILSFAGCATMQFTDEPFSFAKILAQPQIKIIDNALFKTSDNINLAYYEYQTATKPTMVLVFLHGGGACSSAGYQYLAETLSRNYNIKVYLLDMRGHGLSDGKRGDAPSKERLWMDMSEFIAFIKSEAGTASVILGGHSSGGGLVLNYASWKKREEVDGYVFVSPKFGYKSGTDRYSVTEDPFAKVDMGAMFFNHISG
jgi:acylglycerol lipase